MCSPLSRLCLGLVCCATGVRMGLACCAAGVRMIVRTAFSPVDVLETSDAARPRFPARLSLMCGSGGSVVLLGFSSSLAGGADRGE